MSKKNLMSEECSCGSNIQNAKIKQVKEWRENHHTYHPPQPEGTTSETERAPAWDYDNRPPMGFAPNK